MSSIAKYGSWGKSDHEHKFSSTQANLPSALAAKVKAESAKIPDSELADDGREDCPHVTVKYGLHTNKAEDVRRILESEFPIRLKLGKTSIFPDDGERGSDVVKVAVHSTDLHRLNKKISKALPHTDTHPDYHPHVTLAYVKPGNGKKYAGSSVLEGQEVRINRIIFSDKDHKHTEIFLGKKGAAALAGYGS